MDDPSRTVARFPTVRADLMLIHPPAFFDFRHRPDIYFPYLSTSGDVPITPMYEYFPVGFKTLQRYLGERGHDVKIVNLATVLLKYPHADLHAFLRAMEVRLFGIDFHWMVHVQGSLEIASLLKSIHPGVPVIFGGISSTYYAHELIRYPCVDMVMRGYDTHEPMVALLWALKQGVLPREVPNLLWKDPGGRVLDNGLTYHPNTFQCSIDWSGLPHGAGENSIPILEILSTQNVGCAYNCGWCGGSRDAFRRTYQTTDAAVVRKPLREVAYEFETMKEIPNLDRYYFYSVGAYNETPDRLRFFLDRVAEANFRSISYEQFHLTPGDVLEAMARAHERTIITLSPESHDVRVSKLAGRGVYTPDEMERWIRQALDVGIHEIDVWYFVGMPEQDEESVFGTVDYCGRLLRLFKGERVVPLLCPMIPYLDPGSTFFEHPAEHGYRTFYRTVEEHRSSMQRASIIHRINYETRWLDRSALVFTGYRAVRRLVELKGEFNLLPGSVAESVIARIDDALEWIRLVHEIDCIPDTRARARALEGVSAEVLARNNDIFFSGVANQAFPVNRKIGGRWFDELLQPPEALSPLG